MNSWQILWSSRSHQRHFFTSKHSSKTVFFSTNWHLSSSPFVWRVEGKGDRRLFTWNRRKAFSWLLSTLFPFLCVCICQSVSLTLSLSRKTKTNAECWSGLDNCSDLPKVGVVIKRYGPFLLSIHFQVVCFLFTPSSSLSCPILETKGRPSLLEGFEVRTLNRKEKENI